MGYTDFKKKRCCALIFYKATNMNQVFFCKHNPLSLPSLIKR